METQRESARPRSFLVRADDAGRRLDRVLRKLLPRASLAGIYAGLRRGEARVDGRHRTPEYRVREGEEISLEGSLLGASGPRPPPTPPSAAQEREVALLVVYRSEHVVVFNKPPGIPVHGEDSLASRAAGLLDAAAQPSLSFRPGPVHRLDRDTSGLVFFAVSLTGARVLSALLRNRACEKTYLALLEGDLPGREVWEDALTRDHDARLTVPDADGASAVTEAAPLLRRGGVTLARVRIESGRTHQIRAHAALRGHPLLGDTRYGGTPAPGGYVLHAARFRLPPGTEIADRTVFTAPLPRSSAAVLEERFGTREMARAVHDLLGEAGTGEEG